jgi:trypsin
MFRQSFIVALALSLGIVVQADVKFGEKIVGGVPAEKGELPFQVSLQSTWGGHFCGGSLIKPNWVLTAAHCVDDDNMKVVIGLYNQGDMTGAEVFKPVKIIAHPQFNRDTLDYDYALIQLDGQSTYQPIDLNRSEIDLSAGPVNVWTSGWGTTSEGSFALPKILNKVEIPLVPTDVCNSKDVYDGGITEHMICAGLPEGGKDSCQGDSGGPLFMKQDGGAFKLVGIVSWGEGCARPNKYGVYTKVNVMTEWIDTNSQ